MPQLLKNPQTPPLYDLLMYMKAETMLDLRVCLPAIITKVDAATGLVAAKVAMSQQSSSGAVMQYPELTECPVVTIQGGGVGTAFSIIPGDACLVLFSDRCLDSWLQTGAPMLPPNGRTHDLSDGFVLVGVNANSEATRLKTPLLAGEGGLCETKSLTGAKVAINATTHLITISNGPLPVNNLNGILQIVFTALAADPGLSPATQGVIIAAQASLATVLY